MSGMGYIDIAPELLPFITALLPATYQITGSLDCSGYVRLAVKSDQLPWGEPVALTVTVADDGGQRTVSVERVKSP